MLNFQGTVYIRTGLLTHCPFVGGSIFLVNPGSVLSINQHTAGSSRFFKVMNITPEARSLESPMGLARRLIMMWIAGAGLLVSASPMA